MSSALILGHSFTKRAQRYLLNSKSDLLKLKQYEHVFFHGIGGMTVESIRNELDMIKNLENIKVVIIDIGSNDLTTNIKTTKLCRKVIKIAKKIVKQHSIKVVIMQQFKRVKSTGNFSVAQYNWRVMQFNDLMVKSAAQLQNIKIHKIRNMIPLWERLLCKDGVHLNSQGLFRYCRNYRAALVREIPLRQS